MAESRLIKTAFMIFAFLFFEGDLYKNQRQKGPIRKNKIQTPHIL